MSEAKPRSRAIRLAFSLAFLAVLAVLLSLGTWQVRRLAWKEQLLAERAERMEAPAIPLAGLIGRMTASMPDEPGKLLAPTDPEFVPVTVRGTYLPGKEMYFLATDGDGRPGFHVYQPMALGDGRFVIVNRGFVDEDHRDPKSFRPFIQSETDVTGLARSTLAEKPGFFLPDNDLKAGLYFWKDWSAMVRQSGLDPAKTVNVFIDAGKGAEGDIPKGGVTLVDLPNNHLQYAVTWYGLAAALVGVALFARFRRRV